MINKQQIIRALMLSPYYYSLTLRERRLVIQELANRYGRKQSAVSGGGSILKPQPPLNR